MTVVAAGVHHADALAVPFGTHLRCKRQIDLLRHRQGVHIGPQRDHRAGHAALEQADDAGVGHAGADLVEAERAQVLGDDAGGAEFAIAEFGVLVQVAPPGDHLGFDGAGSVVDTGVQRKAGDGDLLHEALEQEAE